MEKNYVRQIALEWWRGISMAAKIDYVKSWQRSLPKAKYYGSAKDWAFELINSSSLHIELIYRFINKVK